METSDSASRKVKVSNYSLPSITISVYVWAAQKFKMRKCQTAPGV